jgi:hypothetical protein
MNLTPLDCEAFLFLTANSGVDFFGFIDINFGKLLNTFPQIIDGVQTVNPAIAILTDAQEEVPQQKYV